MKKNHFISQLRFCGIALLGVGALMLSSCADDGYDDDERWSSVKGQELSSPSAESIVITPSVDGKSQTVSWPVVAGADGYVVSLYDTSQETPLVADSLVDGCSIVFSREEDVNYKLTILTVAGEGNTLVDANPTEVAFSTFTPTWNRIPAGSDIGEWLAANPAPADTIGNLNIDLEGGADYVVSGPIDFGANVFTLRSTSKTNPAKIKFTGENAGFIIQMGFTLKYLDIDCQAMDEGLIVSSKEPVVSPIVVNAWSADWNMFVIQDPVSVLNCKVSNLKSFIYWDNNYAVWMPKTILIDNSVIQLATTTDAKCKSLGYVSTNKGGGFIQSLTVNNSTIYNTGEGQAKYFAFYGGFGISQTKENEIGWIDNQITYSNCTFYNVCKDGQWGNYNGIAGKTSSFWTMKNCIFWNCSSSGVARRFLAGKQNQKTAEFANNTYVQNDGEKFDTPTNYDNSGTDIQFLPVFADPANGDFTLDPSCQQAIIGTGDPRWLPSAE